MNAQPPTGVDAGFCPTGNAFRWPEVRKPKTSGFVGVEDLHVKGLIRNRCLSRSFSDAAVGKLLDLLASKVKSRGGILIKVDRFFPSSQLCHRCGARKTDLTLEDRIFACPNAECGYVGDRDENAARNIILEALRLFGLAPPHAVGESGYRWTENSLWTWGKTCDVKSCK